MLKRTFFCMMVTLYECRIWWMVDRYALLSTHCYFLYIYSWVSSFFFLLRLHLIYTIEIATVERLHVVARWKFDICGQVLIQVKYWKEEDTIWKDIDKDLSHRFLFLFIFDIDRYIFIQLSIREWIWLWLLLNSLIIDRITFIKKREKWT